MTTGNKFLKIENIFKKHQGRAPMSAPAFGYKKATPISDLELDQVHLPCFKSNAPLFEVCMNKLEEKETCIWMKFEY